MAVIAALLAMRFQERAAPAPWRSAREQLTEALRYVVADPIVRALMAIVGLSSGLAFSLVTVMPAWSVTILHGNAQTNGLLQSARGVGALVAALVVASIGGLGYRGRLLTAGTFAMPVFMALFDRATTVPASLAALAALGASMILVANLANALIQAQVPDRLRGRVMSMYTLTMFGMLPVGSLIIGGLAEYLGEQPAVLSCAGILVCVSTLMYMLAPQLRKLE
jgi:MFS family permease